MCIHRDGKKNVLSVRLRTVKISVQVTPEIDAVFEGCDLSTPASEALGLCAIVTKSQIIRMYLECWARDPTCSLLIGQFKKEWELNWRTLVDIGATSEQILCHRKLFIERMRLIMAGMRQIADALERKVSREAVTLH